MSKWCNECYRNQITGEWESCGPDCPAFGIDPFETFKKIIEQDIKIQRLQAHTKEVLNRFVAILKSHSYYPADTYKGRIECKVVDIDDIDMELDKMLEELK